MLGKLVRFESPPCVLAHMYVYTGKMEYRAKGKNRESRGKVSLFPARARERTDGRRIGFHVSTRWTSLFARAVRRRRPTVYRLPLRLSLSLINEASRAYTRYTWRDEPNGISATVSRARALTISVRERGAVAPVY